MTRDPEAVTTARLYTAINEAESACRSDTHTIVLTYANETERDDALETLWKIRHGA